MPDRPDSPPLPGCLALHSRRDFLHRAGLVAVAGTLGFGLTGCASDAVDAGDDDDFTPGAVTVDGDRVSIDLTAVPELDAAGGFLYVAQAGGRAVNVIVVNPEGDAFKAFTSICTHQQNPVRRYDASARELHCPTHNSYFNLDGVRLRGPAPAGSRLTEYAVSRDGNTLVVDKGTTLDAVA